MEFNVQNVNDGLATALVNLAHMGQLEPSRNGAVIVFPEPVLTRYHNPEERVLFSTRRDANPYFHLMEALWMLAGRNDVQWITQFNSKFDQFSDDGHVFHGAYGYRWLQHFGYNQLDVIAREMRSNPNSRRCVLSMWDPTSVSIEIDGYNPRIIGADDLHYAVTDGTKDAPCNTHAYFEVRHGMLNLTVCCRSNDLWLGCYGANAVHFSVLHELMAAWIGVPLGYYRQFSNNLHFYVSKGNELGIDLEGDYKQNLIGLATDVETADEYLNNKHMCTYPLVEKHRTNAVKWWFEDLDQFMRNPLPSNPFIWRNSFFPNVAVPMYESWMERKQKHGTGFQPLVQMPACDWRQAAWQWIQRREDAKRQPPAASA